MTQSKHDVTHGKENKETKSDHALPVALMLGNCPEDSWEFYVPDDGYKTPVPSQKEERLASCWQNTGIPGSRVGVEIFTHWIRKKETGT